MLLWRAERGWTLIELVLVVAVVAILAAILVPTVFSILDDSAITKGKADVKAIAGAIAKFRDDTGEFPTRDDAAGQVNLLFSGTVAPVAAEHVSRRDRVDQPVGQMTWLTLAPLERPGHGREHFRPDQDVSLGDVVRTGAVPRPRLWARARVLRRTSRLVDDADLPRLRRRVARQ